jgi:diacylglycerol O-acyltransferase / wax synthase
MVGADHAELTPMDVLMLKGDSDPRTRAIMTGVLTLDHSPDRALLAAAFGRASHAIPRMRQRVIGPVLPGMSPEWCPDPEFDMDYHVRRIGVANGGDLDEVLELAAALSTAPLDAARPLWEATLVEGLADGRAVLIFRAHHALTDGLGAVAVLAGLLDLDSGVTPSMDHAAPPHDPQRHTGPSIGAPRRLVRLQRASAIQVGAAMRRSTFGVRAGARLARSPSGAVRGAVEMASSLARVTLRPVAPTSRLLRGRSRRRTFRSLEVPLDVLRAASTASGCTVNDAYLSALLGGFRRYYTALGGSAADVPLALPMSTRTADNSAAGNHFSLARLSGPASVADPVERMRLIHDLVRDIRAEPAVQVIDAVADVLQHVPARLAIRGLTAHAHQVDLHASNLTGPPVGVFVAGVRVCTMVPFGPLTGVPVMAVLLSYAGRCEVGFTLDPAAVTDPALFVHCMAEGFAEVIEVGEAESDRFDSCRLAAASQAAAIDVLAAAAPAAGAATL